MKQYIDQNGQPFASLAVPVWRGSTVVFDNFEDFANRKARQPDGYSYGLTGNPTSRELERRIAALENGKHCVVVPSGQSALMTTVMGFIRGGDHILISESCYGALKTFAKKWLANMGVEVEFFPPTSGRDIESRVKPNTKFICMESPGTVTMEMQDIDGIVEVARCHGIRTMIDNTWASPLYYKPLDHGVDFCIESATKMFGGHSDLLLGAIIMNHRDDYAVLRETQSILGQNTCPEDCYLVLRGLETFELRMRWQSASTMKIVRWLSRQPQVDRIFFPALESDPGYALWKKNYSGNGCLFSFTFKKDCDEAVSAFFNALKVFPIGASWGGTHSLIAYYPAAQQQARLFAPTRQAVVRVAVGIQDPDVLISDLAGALDAWDKQLS